MASGLVEKGKGISSEATSGVMQGILKERDKVFSRPGDAVHKKDGLVEELVRSAAAGIGVISEALHHRKEKKAKQSQQSEGPQHIQTADEPYQSRLDIATSHLEAGDREAVTRTASSTSPKDSKDSGNLATAFVSRHEIRPKEPVVNHKPLPLPVVLPQRRPEKRARGFIRAYAPVLAEVGVDQDTFLDFIDTFNKALEPSPCINALNLAGFAGSAMPEPASMLFGFGVEYVTEAVLEGHSRYSSNAFLDRVNAQYFHPRGLVCLVVTWQPGISDNQLTVNFEGDATASLSEPGISERITDIATQKTSAREGWQGMKDQMGEMMRLSNGNFDWPEPAPLVFPIADDGAGSGSDTGAKKKNAFDRMEMWMGDISDKRAQAKWLDENGDKPSASLMPNHEFRSRYADPKHPAASGDIVALVTGGRWMYADKKHAEKCTAESKPEKDTSGEKFEGDDEEKPEKRENGARGKQDENAEGSNQATDSEKTQKHGDDEKSKKSKDEKKAKKDEDKKAKKEKDKRAKEAKFTEKRDSSGKNEDWLKCLFQKDVLYLVVINLPTKQQLADAAARGTDDVSTSDINMDGH